MHRYGKAEGKTQQDGWRRGGCNLKVRIGLENSYIMFRIDFFTGLLVVIYTSYIIYDVM